MSTIKKPFVEIYNILESNQNKKVKDLLEQLLPLMESQQRNKAYMEDDDGLWIFCYYHKEWELTKQVEYGSKQNTATGLNSMCKVGTNQWTKQQREYKQAKSDLLEQVANGELEVTDIQDAIDKLEEERQRIVPLIESHWDEALKMNETKE